ncbi:MAG: APC family permease [Chthonomonadales bacterium]|nr:APC family permease [Chthonomonadales bacterium]
MPDSTLRARQVKRQGIHPINPLRLLLFGRPIATEQAETTRLPKIIALPVFASDAISSSAYATQEILLVLCAAGLWAVHTQLYRSLPVGITLSIVALLAVVVVSYWQTIFAYPSGGGSYVVSKENLGAMPGLIAGAALLIDYVLTVAVSIASGVQNIIHTPALSALSQRGVEVCVVLIVLLCIANLRGLRETGTVFAVPTYFFVTMAGIMIILGLFGPSFGYALHTQYVNRELPPEAYHPATDLAGLALIALVLKAFASGCAAMTGTEAIANCVPEFRKPASPNAAKTLAMMAVILSGLFIGITTLAVRVGVVYGHHGRYTSPAVIDQLSGTVFGRGSAAYYMMQIATMTLLVFAANTSFAGFPRLAAILSRDRFLPRQLSNQGDKLVFSNGIVLLALFAIVLIVAFHGSVDRLIPLYAVGVFTAFTLSQTGMVRHWQTERGPRWAMKAVINGLGACCTFIVLLIIAFEKFRDGAWIVIFVVTALVLMFRAISRHYEFVRSRLTIQSGPPVRRVFTGPEPPTRQSADAAKAQRANTVLILVPSLHRGVFPALEYGRSLSYDCRAIHIETDPNEVPRLKREWEEHVGEEIPLVILPSPYRSFIGPLMAYLDEVQKERDNHIVTVVLPEFVSTKWWHGLLHNANGPLVKMYLSQRPGVVIVNVRYFLGEQDPDAQTGARAASNDSQ